MPEMLGSPAPPVPAKDTIVAPGPTNLMLGMSSQPSSAVPTSFLGNLNPLAGRPVTWQEAVKLTIPSESHVGIHMWKPVDGTNFKSWTAGYSVVTLTALQYTLYPSPGAKDMQVSLKYCWVPAGETAPTDEASMSIYPSYTIEYLQPNVAGSMPPPITITCPIGTFDLARNVKPKPLAGGVPQLSIIWTAHKVADGSVVPNSTELGKLVCRLSYQVGM